MDWLKRMNQSIDYIEEHLDNKLEISDIAKVAYSSKFHFQRLFHMLCGITVAEYVRNRRLTLAAQELTTSNCKVIDVCYKYGYESPESFSRAFYKLHGVSPSKVKKGTNLTAYPRISFQIQLKGEKEMDYRIERKEAFHVMGVKREVTTVNNQNFEIIPQFWSDIMKNGTFEKLMKQTKNGISYGICMDFIPEEEKFNYLIGINHNANDNEFEVREIPACTWAIFDASGPLPDAVIEVTNRIFHEWFPATGYEHANAPEIEVYYPNENNSDKMKTEIWIPIIQK